MSHKYLISQQIYLLAFKEPVVTKHSLHLIRPLGKCKKSSKKQAKTVAGLVMH